MYSASDENVFLDEKQNTEIKKKSRVAVLLALLFWIIALGYPLFSYTFPPPEKPGILLSFGDFEGGGNESSDSELTDGTSKETSEEESSAPQKNQDSEASKQETAVKSPPSKVVEKSTEQESFETTQKETTSTKEVKNPQKSTDTEKNDALKKAQEEAAQKQQREEAEKQRKAEEAAKKKEFSDLFSGSGSGSKPQNQGDPNGEPDKKKLEGITTGTGKIGDGLKDRGVLYEPDIDENSQKVGRIVVRVCVNAKGLVTEARYTQLGSTSTDITLIKVAEEAAWKYRFSPSGLEKQCGSISIDFKLK